MESAEERPESPEAVEASAELSGGDPRHQELEKAHRRVDELARAYQALQRDQEEFKQRLTRERERLLEVEKGKVFLLVIEAIDELDLALGAAGPDGSPLAQGVRLIREKLLKRLSGEGIERIQAAGQRFDPAWAEAADMEITGDSDDDQKVIADVRGGYRMGTRVLRPARVKVAKYVRPADA